MLRNVLLLVMLLQQPNNETETGSIDVKIQQLLLKQKKIISLLSQWYLANRAVYKVKQTGSSQNRKAVHTQANSP